MLAVALTACGPAGVDWHGGHPICATAVCPAHDNFVSWHSAVVGSDDRTLTIKFVGGCRVTAAPEPVKVAETSRAVVIGVVGSEPRGAMCISANTVTVRLTSRLAGRPIYDAKTDKGPPVTRP